MKRIKVERIMRDGKCMILAYDQGLEHGPADLNEKTVDPNYVLDIALEGRYTAIALQSGIADKYYMSYFKDVPLIIKLNGKTAYQKEDIVSLQHTTVKHALNLGAVAVGYTLYLGSRHEQEMFVEFGRICDQAHNAGIPVICWMSSRGEAFQTQNETNTIAYATRCAMELGADFVAVNFNEDKEGMRWAVKCAGKTKVIMLGGERKGQNEFLKSVQDALDAGAAGVAVGRNVWQQENPFDATRALKEVIFNKKNT